MHIETERESLIFLTCQVFSCKEKQKHRESKWENMNVHYHQSTSKWVWEVLYRHTNKYRHPHSHPHKKCHYDLVFSAAVGYLQLDKLTPIESLSPTELGSASTKSVTQREMADMTPDAALMSVTVVFTFGCCRRSGGRSKKRGRTSVTVRTQADSLSDSPHTQLYFPLPLFEIPHSFFFCVLAKSVCFALCQAAGSFVCTFVLSHHPICVVLSFTPPAKSQLPDNLTGIG